MKENPIDQGRFTIRGQGVGTVTEAMVRQRAAELALINGRSRHNILKSDLEEARRELTGQEGLIPNPEPEEELDESQRWDPIGGSSGTSAPTVPPPDEQAFPEKLVEEGVDDAEQDQMVEGTQESIKRDTES
jgi:hypothetical protein